MIYLDYSATTFPNSKVIDDFTDAAKKYRGNPNSHHVLGIKAKERINSATSSISKILGVKENEIIYTSGASESNNLAIKGICEKYKKGHIITTRLEHSSVIAPINRVCNNDFEVSFAKLREDGTIDIDYLKGIIREDTYLVSIVGVDSELGIRENIEEVGELLKNYPNITFHVDATQLIGKTYFDFKNVDLVSFSAHKFFGIKAIGCLIKKENIKLIPQIDGGASTTKYRSGTPALELIVSLETALSLAYKDFDEKLKYIEEISSNLKDFLKSYPDIKINNTSKSINQIINFSITNSKKLVDLLTKKEICISTKSACSSQDSISKAVMCLYNDESRANESIRISVSYVTTKEEVEKFKKIFDECYKKIGDNYENN